jgi:hypothetical protein
MAGIVDNRDAFERLGREPTVTFGVVTHELLENDEEIVGPLNPKHVQYGTAWTGTHSKPTVFLNFNKYRSDLPPWDNVEEFVLAARDDDGEVVEYAFKGLVHHLGTKVTGDLKTVNIAAMYCWNSLEHLDIIDRKSVAAKRERVGDDG